jgi:chromate transporter
MDDRSVPTPRPPLSEFLLYWFKLGCVSFGGPAGQIAMMQADLVERKRWVDPVRFLHMLNFCMLLPGPEAQQLATYIGWRLYGARGGLIAGGLFVLPGALAMLALSWLAARHGDAAPVAAVLAGVKPAVVAVIAAAVWRVGRRALKGPAAVALAVAAFLALFVLGLPFPAVVGAALLTGVLAERAGWTWFAVGGTGPAIEEPPVRIGGLVRLAAVFLLTGVVPVAGVVAWLGPEPWLGLAALMTKAAFVTFGGAYAVLPYVAAQAVEVHGWLSPSEMVDGLALAETTPGPLILVLEYVGFFTGWHAPGGLPPLWAGVLGAALTVHLTFLPSFLFVFAGAPFAERAIRSRAAAGALAAVAAAVVGVMANLGVYLGLAVLTPGGTPDSFAIMVALAALVLLTQAKLAVPWVVLLAALAGMGRMLAGS